MSNNEPIIILKCGSDDDPIVLELTEEGLKVVIVENVEDLYIFIHDIF